MKDKTELDKEIKQLEEKMLGIRRRFWDGEEPFSEAINMAMEVAECLCKLSAAVEKVKGQSDQEWLQSSRRSVKAQYREFLKDAIEKRSRRGQENHAVGSGR